MSKTRLEAFSDGVIAIVITIMVLELEVPQGSGLSALRPFLPLLGTYVLSFAFVGIYWNNHHHMLQASEHINGKVLWANLHLLFWLSLIPVGTHWLGESGGAPWPAAAYGVVMLMSGTAYRILQTTLLAAQSEGSTLHQALEDDRKGIASVLLYASAVPLAFVDTRISIGIYVVVALLWLVPDPRIEAKVATRRERGDPRRAE